MDQNRWRTWRAAMTDALYGDAGFYTSSGSPARHFRTAAHATTPWAAAIHRLAVQVNADLPPSLTFTIVDVGAGGGEMLAALAESVPHEWKLVGVDIAPRPAGLPERVAWSGEPPTTFDGLLIANELLDVVPVDVVERHEGWARQVEVTPTGDEELGGMVTGRDAAWLAEWWPLAEDGDRAEVGWPRDLLWHSLTARLGRGVAIAIDYAADPSHDVAGTMTSYRDGRQIDPTPDGSCDITAHVLFDSLGVPGDILISQRDALQQLGVIGDRPAYDGDSASYLSALSTTGEQADLLDLNGLGSFTWLVHAKGVPVPLTARDDDTGDG